MLGSGFLFSAAIFSATALMVVAVATVILPAVQTRRRIADQLHAEGIRNRRSLEARTELTKIAARRPVDAYFKALDTGQPDALEAKLFRAGFHQQSAPAFYAVIRIGSVALGFVLAYFILSRVLPPQLPAIMTLQMRAGKPLRDALRELADRIGIDEARSLAVLFRQSEELGTSLTEALRVYSDEMRTQRILRAEEKANALPVKMVLPLGLCVFPVVLMIVMLPVILRMKGVFF